MGCDVIMLGIGHLRWTFLVHVCIWLSIYSGSGMGLAWSVYSSTNLKHCNNRSKGALFLSHL
ncbi:hypothetical protein BDZ91DRAFT_718200 [Kalaharituber pfeilii]|nr:hypothetical protein BDZ91DRAFT_718200 [Kalaharituber pfeilii]